MCKRNVTCKYFLRTVKQQDTLLLCKPEKPMVLEMKTEILEREEKPDHERSYEQIGNLSGF